MVAAVQQYTLGTSNANSMLPPPPPGDTIPVPPVVDTDPSRAGASFGRRGTRRGNESGGDSGSVSQVSMVSINGRSYNGPVFDATGNRIA